MRFAFKEWAIVVEALGSGEQIVILRKGGISEGRRGFQVEHAEFLLYPTLFHQQRESILSAWWPRLDKMQVQPESQAPADSRVSLEFFAHVVSWRRLDSLARAQRLAGQHIWHDEVIAQRFDWSKEKCIFALAVRVFRLPQPVEVPALTSMAGCKSWIDLEQEIPTDGAVPVLSKEAFNEKLNQFHAALDEEGSTEPGLNSP
jgi:hypothetical protein